MSKRINWDYNLVKEFIKNNNCILISENYTKMNDYINIKCECGETFKTTFSKFVNRNKRKCNKCSGIIYWDIKSVCKYIEENSNCKLISTEFKDVDSKIKILCKCGNAFETSFYKFKSRNKKQCNKCSGVFEYNFDNIKEIIENEYSKICNIKYFLPQQEYLNASSRLLILDEYGYKYESDITSIKSNIKRSSILSRFYIFNPYTIYNINNYLKINNLGYKLISDGYTNTDDLLEWECKKGHKYKSNWSNFQYGKRCPYCTEYKNENEIANYLESNNIYFKRQFKFPDCKNIFSLPFDFAILNKNNEILGLIEYDGEFHEKPFRNRKDDNSLVKLHHTQYNDRIKNVYCKINKIPLLRINFRDKKIKFQLIDDFLIKKY